MGSTYNRHVTQLREAGSDFSAPVTYAAPFDMPVSRGSPAQCHLGFSESCSKRHGAFDNTVSSSSPGGQLLWDNSSIRCKYELLSLVNKEALASSKAE